MYEAPKQLFVTKRLEGEYSTILHDDGTVETILFRRDGSTVGPVFTVAKFRDIHESHIETLKSRDA